LIVEILGEFFDDQVIGGVELMQFFEEKFIVLVLEPFISSSESITHNDASNNCEILKCL